MTCFRLIKGFEACDNSTYRVEQEVVFINHADLHEIYINNSQTQHNIYFNLIPNLATLNNAKGVKFKAIDAGDSITAGFEMQRSRRIPTYEHRLTILVGGIDENYLTLQKQLDKGSFIGAVRFSTGEVQILGLESGLRVEPYDRDYGNKLNTLELVSGREYFPPYLYDGDADDFNIAWDSGSQVVRIRGDFNDDFNDDFYNRNN